MLHLYAITDSPVGPTVEGLHGARLRRIESGRLAGLASEHAVAPELDEEVLWAHERVVEELMTFGTILPLRFGSSVERAEALVAMMADRREEFLDALERVRGSVEISVRAELPGLDPEGFESPPPSGTAYLLKRAERERRSRDAAELIHRPLAALARRSTQPAGAPDTRQFKAAYLVDEAEMAAFGKRVEALNRDLDGFRVSCTGPWPPYSFVMGGSA
jgi:hypothetical protein